MIDDREYLPNSTFKRPRKPMNKFNRERRARLYAKQFGAKADWVRGMPCCVSGKNVPVDVAHVDGTRGAGADNSMIVPMCREAHRDFDEQPDEKFLEIWGVSKEMVREQARALESEWLRMMEEGGEP